MKYLTIDTTTKVTALSLAEISGDNTTDRPWQEVHVVGEVFLHDQKTHSERLIPFLDALLAAASWTLEELDYIGVVRGPGSFTGIRIGIATAQGLAKVLGRPVLGVLSLDCLSWASAPLAGTLSAPSFAEGASGAIPLISAVILDARKNEWYAACYQWEKGKRLCLLSPCAVVPEDFLRWLQEKQELVVFAGDAVLSSATRRLITDGLGRGAHILPQEQALPRGSYAAKECVYAQHMGMDLEFSPYYIRLSEAEAKRRSTIY